MAHSFVLQDLIDPELRLIEQAIGDGKVYKDARCNIKEPPTTHVPT